MDGSFGGGDKSGDHSHGGRFSGTVGSQESDDLTGFHFKTDVIDSALSAIFLDQVLNGNIHVFDQNYRCFGLKNFENGTKIAIQPGKIQESQSAFNLV